MLVSNTIPNLINGVSQQPDLVRLPSQCEEMTNCYPTLESFLRRRPATKHLARLLETRVDDAFVHIINRDAGEQYIVIFLPGDVKVYRLDGTPVTVNFPNGRAYLPHGSVSRVLRCMTINDYTFVVNTGKTTAMKADTSPVPPPQALVFVKATNYSTTYTVTLDGTHKAEHVTRKDDDEGRIPLSSTTIAKSLCNQINAFGPYVAVVEKSTVHITGKTHQHFNIKVDDSRSNTHISLATDSVQRFTDLPTIAPEGYTVEVTGDASSSFDNYFTRFKVNAPGESFGQGIWEEAVKPGITYALDENHMPHALVREAGGSFSFKPLEWEDRLCGDEDSVPTPSFIDRKLSAVFFYRNRLGFLANENVVLSEAGKFFNFFATTATAMVDSDPVDVAASHTRATSLYHAVPFSEGLLIFSDQTQFKLDHPDDILSNATVAVKPLTEFEASPDVQPIGAGKNIFFAVPRGKYTNIMEYFVQADTAITDAANVTNHTPRYVPAGAHRLVSSTNEDVLLVLSTDNPHEICVYKYLWNNNEKLQSAWFKWVFTGGVLGAAFLETKIYLVMQYADGLYLEVMDVQPGLMDEGREYEVVLDRKVTEQTVTNLHWNSYTRTTTFTMPYPIPAEAKGVKLVILKDEKMSPEEVPLVTSFSGREVTVQADLRVAEFTVGLVVPSRFTFSKQYMREKNSQGTGAAILGGRLQLRNMRISYHNSGYFQVGVTPMHRSTSIYTFTGRETGLQSATLGPPEFVGNTGTFPVPLPSKADQTEVFIQSDSHLPFHFVNAEWEGFYHLRSTRV